MSANTITSAAPTRSAALPLLLLAAAVIAGLGVQTWQLRQDRQQIDQTREALAKPLGSAQQPRQQLDQLASATQTLAQQGNANAQAMVAELQKNGISIRAP